MTTLKQQVRHGSLPDQDTDASSPSCRLLTRIQIRLEAPARILGNLGRPRVARDPKIGSMLWWWNTVPQVQPIAQRDLAEADVGDWSGAAVYQSRNGGANTFGSLWTGSTVTRGQFWKRRAAADCCRAVSSIRLYRTSFGRPSLRNASTGISSCPSPSQCRRQILHLDS